MLSVLLLALATQDAPAEMPVFVIPAPVTAPAAATASTESTAPAALAVPFAPPQDFSHATTQPAQAKAKKLYGSILDRQAIANTVVISRATLERNRYRTLAEALDDVAEFYVVRGMTGVVPSRRWPSDIDEGATRTVYMLNGVPLRMLHGIETGSDILPIDLESVEQIEIVRNSSGVAFGERSEFGVINIVTRDPGKHGDAALGGRLGAVRDGYLRYSRRIGEQWVFVAANQDGEHAEFDRESSKLRSRLVTATGVAGPWSLNAYAGDAIANADFWRRPSGTPDVFFTFPSDDPAKYLTSRMGAEGRFDYHHDWYTISAHVGHERVRLREYSLSESFEALNDRTEIEERRLRSGVRFGMDLPFRAHLIAFGDYARLDGITPRMNGPSRGQTSAGWHDRSAGLLWSIRPTSLLGAEAGVRAYRLGMNTNPGTAYQSALAFYPRSRSSIKLIYAEGFRGPTFFERSFRTGFASDRGSYWYDIEPQRWNSDIESTRSYSTVVDWAAGLLTAQGSYEHLRKYDAFLKKRIFDAVGTSVSANLNPLRIDGQASGETSEYSIGWHWAFVGQVGGPTFIEGFDLATAVRFDSQPGNFYGAQEQFWRWDFTATWSPTKVLEVTAKLRNAFEQAVAQGYREELGTAGDRRTFWVGLAVRQD